MAAYVPPHRRRARASPSSSSSSSSSHSHSSTPRQAFRKSESVESRRSQTKTRAWMQGQRQTTIEQQRAHKHSKFYSMSARVSSSKAHSTLHGSDTRSGGHSTVAFQQRQLSTAAQHGGFGDARSSWHQKRLSDRFGDLKPASNSSNSRPLPYHDSRWKNLNLDDDSRFKRDGQRPLHSRTFGERDCFGFECKCRMGQASVYPATRPRDHTVHFDALPKGQSLLGHHGQLCGGYYHTAPSTEAGNPQLCLGMDVCAKAPSCILVVRVDEKDDKDGTWRGPTFVARYHNCYRGYENSVHAEQFMMADPVLLAALGGDPSTAAGAPFYVSNPGAHDTAASDNGNGGDVRNNLPKASASGVHRRLTMYITQQPCHHSSGRVETKHVSANTSCTNRILEWKRGVLSGLDVELVFKLSRVFRAHWEDDSVHENAEDSAVFGSRARMAKQGLQLLINEPGISVTMIEVDGWKWLANLCDPYVVDGGKMLRNGSEVELEPQMTDDVISERVEADEYFVKFLLGLKRSE